MSTTATPVRRAIFPPAAALLPVFPGLPLKAHPAEPSASVLGEAASQPAGAEAFALAAASADNLAGVAAGTEPNPTVLPLTGIARLAASAPKELEGKGVEYFRLPVRTVLNRVVSERVSFPWSINPYRGCEFGCRYCYARYTHEYMELDPAAFENKIYVKDEAAKRLRRELTPERVLGQHIAIGAATDPYQPAERRFGVTRAILETLLEFAKTLPGGGLSLSITTKSNLVLRDVELLRELGRGNRLHVNLSLTTLNPRLARVLEPRAPRPDLRLETVRQLNDAGVTAGVFLAPILPGLTDAPEDLEAVVAASAAAQAKYLCANVVFLMPSSQKVFFPWLEEKFPRLRKQYRKWFRRSGYAPEAYGKKISALMHQLRARYRLSGRWADDDVITPGYRRGSVEAAAGDPRSGMPQLDLPFVPGPPVEIDRLEQSC